MHPTIYFQCCYFKTEEIAFKKSDWTHKICHIGPSPEKGYAHLFQNTVVSKQKGRKPPSKTHQEPPPHKWRPFSKKYFIPTLLFYVPWYIFSLPENRRVPDEPSCQTKYRFRTKPPFLFCSTRVPTQELINHFFGAEIIIYNNYIIIIPCSFTSILSRRGKCFCFSGRKTIFELYVPLTQS